MKHHIKSLIFIAFALFKINDSYSQISSQPQNSSICSGSNSYFRIHYNFSFSPNFQWQRKFGTNWVSLSNGSIYRRVSSDSMSIIAPPDSLDGSIYRCVVDSAGVVKAISDSAKLTILKSTTILTQPSSQAICAGNSVSFSVTASGGGTLTYQWRKGTTTISGATSSSYTISSVIASDAGNYNVIVNGACGSANSNNAALTVNPKTTISAQPKSQTICSGSPVTFTISATGFGTLNYQWRKNGITIIGANTAAYTIASCSPGDAGTYDVVVTAGCGSITSDSVKLQIYTAPTIISQPIDTSQCTGMSTSFQVFATGSVLLYQWQVNSGSGWKNITTAGSVPVYSGWNSPVLKLTSIQPFNNGFRYKCEISGYCSPSATSSIKTLSVFAPPVITTQPENSRICEGQNTLFNVLGTGTNLKYQWQSNSSGVWTDILTAGTNPSYSGWSTTSLKVNAVTINNSRFGYRCILSGTCIPDAVSTVAQLEVDTLVEHKTGPENVAVCEGQNSSFSVNYKGSGLTYSWQVNSGTGWKNIVSSGSSPSYSNWNSPTLLLNDIKAWNNGYLYRCLVASPCSTLVISPSAELKTNITPTFSSHPVNGFVCPGEQAEFDIIANGTNLNFQWQQNSNALWTDLSENGNFQNVNSHRLFIKNTPQSFDQSQFRCMVYNNGCPVAYSNFAELNVFEQPNADAGDDTGVCGLNPIQLSGFVSGGRSPYKFTWSPPIGLDNPNVLTPNASPVSQTYFTLHVLDFNNCTNTDTVKVNVYKIPVAEAGDDKQICLGSSTKLVAQGGSTFLWTPTTGLDSPNSKDPNASPNVSIEYYVTVTDSNNCASNDSVSVKVLTYPTPIISGPTSTCRNSYNNNYINQNELNLTKWQIVNGELTNNNWSNLATVHWLQDTLGLVIAHEYLRESPFCEAVDTLMVHLNTNTAPDPVSIIPKANNILTGILICPNCTFDYFQWGYELKRDRIEMKKCGNINWCSFNLIDTANYYYWLKSGNDTQCMTKSYFNLPFFSNTQSYPQNSVITLNPNPALDILNIQSSSKINSIKILSLSGAVVMFLNHNLLNNSESIRVNNLQPGVYFIELETDLGFKYAKFIKL